ncbi:MAG: hypothetical protein AABX99_02635 [Nanoarchaeota archaeon]
MEKIEEILVNDPLYSWHIMSKRQPKYNFSGEINSIFLGRDSHLDMVINWIKDYILIPLIEDDFDLIPNQGLLRKKWKRELKSRYGEEAGAFLWRNKLRKNLSLGGLWSASSMIDFYLGDEFPSLGKKAKEVINIIEDNTEEYPQMNNREKIAFVRLMEDKAYGILQELRA